MEKRRSARTAILDPNILRGKDSGVDYDADALTVLILFCRYDGSRSALVRLYIRGVRFREVKSRRERQIMSNANRRFLKALCHRGLLMYQGDESEPHRSCRILRAGYCERYGTK
jgi:hypothetical protein